MPILQRLIEPVHVSRGTLPVEVQNELECTTNGTLANIIRQLSSLSKHAEDIFGVLCEDSAAVQVRMNTMKGRIERLAVKVTQLDSNVEEVSLQDIHMRKAFKSSVVYEQQVVSRGSLPVAMADIYQQCDRPPPLEKLNAYREDGKNGLKFYTDPNYFFDLWRHDQLMETEKMLQGRVKKHGHLHADCCEPHRVKQDGKRLKKVRAAHNSKEKYKQIASTNDVIDHYGPGQGQMRPQQQQQHAYYQENDKYSQQRPNSLELHNSYGQGHEDEIGSQYIAQMPNEPYAPPPYTEQAVYQQNPPPPYSYNEENWPSSPHKGGTPSKANNRAVSSMRPSQPPPAPPPNAASSASSNSTPTPTPSMGTPTNGSRVRASSYTRDSLPPPPPPPPDAMLNGNVCVHPQYQISKDHTGGGPAAASPAHSQSSIMRAQNHMTAAVAGMEHNNNSTPDDLPPPPPTPDLNSLNSHDEHNAGVPSPPLSNANHVPAPPPPPPPVSAVNNIHRPATSELASISSESSTITSSSASRASENNNNNERRIRIVSSSAAPVAAESVDESRSDLLAAIREGFKLRKVEDNKKKEVEKSSTPHDVASILARRVAMEFSDSDSASESDYDSDAWVDDATDC